MLLSEAQRDALGVALNEATLLGVEMQPSTCRAAATFSVLALPEGDGPAAEDRRVQFVFERVGRVAASLRPGNWDDPDAQPIPFAVEELLRVVRSFGGLPIYGWEFFDIADAELARWGRRLSLDWRGECGGVEHSLCLFQEGHDRHLDLCLWFDRFVIRDPAGREIGLEEFTEAGQRWWEAFHNHDPRTFGSGMAPLG